MNRSKGRRSKASCDRVWVEKYYPYIADYALEVCEQIQVPWDQDCKSIESHSEIIAHKSDRYWSQSAYSLGDWRSLLHNYTHCL